MENPLELMPARTPAVTTVIVTYQSCATIRTTLDAIWESHLAGLTDTIIVDNASTDGTADIVAEHYPWVTLIRNNRNTGFGRGCNQGFEDIATPYVLLLNPDAVINLDALTTLVRFLGSHPRAGICAPAVRETSGALQPAGGLPTPWNIITGPLFSRWASHGQRQVNPGDAPFNTDWVCGAVMLLRWKMIERIGGFDPRFFLYFEETDLCYRARQAAWEIWAIGQAVAGHVSGASAKATKAHMIGDTISEHYFKSRFYYLAKHFGWSLAVFAEIGELVFMFLRKVVDTLRGRPSMKLGLRLKSPMFKLPDCPQR